MLTLEQAERISSEITEDDLLHLARVIIGYTNNNFRSKYSAKIIQLEGQLLKIEGHNPFRTGDLVELNHEGTSGHFFIEDVTENGVQINIDNRTPGPIEPDDMVLYLIAFPPDVEIGLADVLKNKTRRMAKAGIKSESIGRMAVTYADVSESPRSIYGVEESQFSFLEPYRKFDWS